MAPGQRYRALLVGKSGGNVPNVPLGTYLIEELRRTRRNEISIRISAAWDRGLRARLNWYRYAWPRPDPRFTCFSSSYHTVRGWEVMLTVRGLCFLLLTSDAITTVYICMASVSCYNSVEFNADDKFNSFQFSTIYVNTLWYDATRSVG